MLAVPEGPAIAVLPFYNLSGDPKQDYFSDGLTEQIIAQFSRFRNIRVIARNSTFLHKGRAVNVRKCGEELKTRYDLEGSVWQDPQRVRVTAQLLDDKHGAPNLAKLLQLNPGFAKEARIEWHKWNIPGTFIDRAIGDLRRAGLAAQDK